MPSIITMRTSSITTMKRNKCCKGSGVVQSIELQFLDRAGSKITTTTAEKEVYREFVRSAAPSPEPRWTGTTTTAIVKEHEEREKKLERGKGKENSLERKRMS
jgi:hypothetical protein